MTLRAMPPWLEELQLRFGRMLAQPLDRAGGTLRATPADYDPLLTHEVREDPRGPAPARLAVYQRQYYFRLFTVLQAAFPLTKRLLGAWTFNEVAARFLAAHPPAGYDIDAVPEGFDSFLATSAPACTELDPEALAEGARIDAAYRRVLIAPEVVPYRPDSNDGPRLLEGRLVPSPAAALLTDSFALCELRRRILAEPGDAAVVAPPRLNPPRSFALVRQGLAPALLPLEALESRLLRLLEEFSVGEALGRLEASCTAPERNDLPERAHRWLRRSVNLGLWVALRT